MRNCACQVLRVVDDLEERKLSLRRKPAPAIQDVIPCSKRLATQRTKDSRGTARERFATISAQIRYL